jgi:hypothetical protein
VVARDVRRITMPRDVERALVVELKPSQKLAPTLSGEGQSNFSLAGGIAEYKDDWTLVSHTFEVQPDGSAVFTVIFERPHPDS